MIVALALVMQEQGVSWRIEAHKSPLRLWSELRLLGGDRFLPRTTSLFYFSIPREQYDTPPTRQKQRPPLTARLTSTASPS